VTEVFVKLMNKGLKSHEHDKFSFETQDGATVRDLIDDLREAHEERFVPYLEEEGSGKLRRDAIVIVNGKNMVAHQGEKTKLSPGDLIVFMIAAAVSTS
jgi:molybdopterin converting factor small subunit